jgi:hypothetical protein
MQRFEFQGIQKRTFWPLTPAGNPRPTGMGDVIGPKQFVDELHV